jgi:hypothetical protein
VNDVMKSGTLDTVSNVACEKQVIFG